LKAKRLTKTPVLLTTTPFPIIFKGVTYGVKQRTREMA